MTIESAGYAGTVDAAQWSGLIPSAGSAVYGVAGAGDWKVGIVGGQDRKVSVAAGTGWGQGVHDVSDAPTPIQLDPIISGSRWDLVVARRDWQAGATTFTAITGTSSKAIPATRTTAHGTGTDDQPLALVRVDAGKSEPQEVVDLRCWAANGGMQAKDTLALGYLDQLGSKVTVGDTTWFYRVGVNDVPEWVNANPRSISYYTSDYKPNVNGNPYNVATIAIPDPGFKYNIIAHGLVEAGGGGADTRWNILLRAGGQNLDAARGDVVAPWFKVAGNTAAALTGPTTVDLYAFRSYGNGLLGVSSFNRFFSAIVIPAQ